MKIEEVLVIHKDIAKELIEQECEVVKGFYKQGEKVLNRYLDNYGEFKERHIIEKDEDYLQIIPYIVFMEKRRGLLFAYKRVNNKSEIRLDNKFSIGVGGHVNYNDYNANLKSYFQAMKTGLRREIEEEISFEREIILGDFNFKISAKNIHDSKYIPKYEYRGLIYDDSNSVGRVHLGILFFADVYNVAGISIKEKDKMEYVKLKIDKEMSESGKNYFETWSSIAFNVVGKEYLVERKA